LAAATTHPDVCAITAAMASSTGLLNFAKEFPDRFFDVGICEQHAVTFAAGLAMAGMRPVVCIYSTFLARAFDQTIMDVALHKLPVVFVIDRAGVTGPDGASHHGIFDLSYLRLIPNLKVAAPKDATELCALLETALATDGPIAIRYPKGPVPATPDLPVQPLPIAKSFTDPMPVLDFVLAELPAQLDELAVAKRREVDQPLERTLELDAHAVEAQHSLEQLLFGTLDSVLRLLLPLAVAAIRAGPLHRVLGHPQLLLEVGPQGGELGDLSHDRAHTRQLPVRFFHGVRAEPLHRSTILRSMDASAMRTR